jgi:hypothetical protein
MTTNKILASAVLVPWIVTVGFICGPVRWELAHSYAHHLEEAQYSLPLLTRCLSLPVLGIATSSPGGFVIAGLFWGFIWLGLVGLFVLIWRARTREDLLDRFVFGAALYAGCVLLLFSLTVVGLALPFAFI